jgi:hypothetical protein
MTIQTAFLGLIALMVPAFFASLFIASVYHRLAARRRRCSEILSEAEATSDTAQLQRLRQIYDEALADDVRVRRRLSGALVATLFRLAPPAPWPSEGRPGLPIEKD